MTKNAIISESYNAAIEAGFNSFLEQHATNINCDIKIDEEKLVKEVEHNWLSKPVEGFEGVTPAEYIASLKSLEDTFELFIEMASVSDVGVPDMLMERLKEHVKPASDMLFRFTGDWRKSQDQSRIMAVTQAVYAIGCLGCEEYKQELIKLLKQVSDDEMLSEAVCAAISEYGAGVLEDLYRAFGSEEQEAVKEYLITCVAEISKGYRSEELFHFLKDAFKVMKNLTLIAEIIGDYGDPRAIPFLRGFVQKNVNKMDKATFNHLRAIIKKLGGEIKDLTYQEQ